MPARRLNSRVEGDSRPEIRGAEAGSEGAVPAPKPTRSDAQPASRMAARSGAAQRKVGTCRARPGQSVNARNTQAILIEALDLLGKRHLDPWASGLGDHAAYPDPAPLQHGPRHARCLELPQVRFRNGNGEVLGPDRAEIEVSAPCPGSHTRNTSLDDGIAALAGEDRLGLSCIEKGFPRLPQAKPGPARGVLAREQGFRTGR